MPTSNSRRTQARPPSKTSFWPLLLAGALVIGLASVLFARPYLSTGSAAEESTLLRISMGGWQPGALSAEAGQPVTVTMVNLDNQFHTDGGGWHNFVVPALGLEVRVPPNGSKTFTFVPEVAGEYEFYCDICCGGKENPFMQGSLKVS